MRTYCLFLLVMFVLIGCQDKKADPIQKTTVDLPNAADAPSVSGKIMMMGEWQDESLAAGFVGKGRDGKTYSNSCGLIFSSVSVHDTI